MVLDPRFSRNKVYLKEIQWESAFKNVVLYLTKDTEEVSAESADEETSSSANTLDSNISSDDIDPDELAERQSLKPKPDNNIREDIRKELDFIQKRSDSQIQPFEFYKTNKNYLQNFSKAVKHFFLASSSAIESESFFSDATALYGNKQRNKLSAASAHKLLQIRVMQKRNNSNPDPVFDEEQESDSDEEF
uniref:HAT C-terminal dimerisation domain-containing protein n=1 Tax=Panagrolaimus sp. ES5 TaxID=591445 RepID=A0AC34F955_9BILA